MTDNLKTIAEHYGLRHQLMKLVEELNELALECAKSYREDSITVNLINEIADVEVMLAQIKYLAKIEQSDIDEVKLYKIKRQLGRIAKEIAEMEEKQE